MSDIVIRHAEPRDAEPLRQITAHPEVYHDTLQLPHPSMEMWQERLLPKPGSRHLVATIDEQVVGHPGSASNQPSSQPRGDLWRQRCRAGARPWRRQRADARDD